VDTSSRWACVLSGMWLDFPSTISRVNVYSIAYGRVYGEKDSMIRTVVPSTRSIDSRF
jgi:hypothetical protein